MNPERKSRARRRPRAGHRQRILINSAPASPAISRRRASRVRHARRALLRSFVGEQIGCIEKAARLMLVYHAANDDFAVAYLAKCIAAHGRALDATVADISAVNGGGG